MKRNLVLALLVSSFALTIGCCPCRRGKGPSVNLPLTQTQWQLAQLNGQNIAPTEDSYSFTLTQDGSVSGKGDCNRIMGKFQTDPTGKISFEQFGTTRMACPNNEQEHRFIQTLEAVTAYKIDGDMLMLLTDGELRAVMQATKK